MMASVVEWLLSTVFSIGSIPVSWLELIGFVSGAVCVWLVGQQNPWNWPIGQIQVGSYLLLFWVSGLYGDASLQIIYLVLGFYGWWKWVTKSTVARVTNVSNYSQKEWIGLTIFLIVGTVVGNVWLSEFTTSVVALPDALTTILSLAAVYGQVKKKLESWYLWILADLIYIPLYISKDLYLTAFLYGIFLLLCIKGLLQWRKDLVK